MRTPETLQQHFVGADIILQVTDDEGNIVDLSSATKLDMVFRKPDNSKVTKAGTLVNTGSDGLMKYTTEPAFLDLPKTWRVQADIATPDWSGMTSVTEFVVLENL